jgi:hypothetical protein
MPLEGIDPAAGHEHAAPSLGTLQQTFYRLMIAPEGAAQGLATLGLDEQSLAAWVASDQRMSALERLDVYANMYFFRIRDVLKEEFEKVVACVGEELFHDLIVEYLQEYPTEHWSLRDAGRRFTGFLNERTISDEQPWLVDLAALERAYLEVFDGPDAETLTVETLQQLAPESFATLELRLLPSLLQLDAEYAVDELWQWLEEGGAPMPAAVGARKLIVWRQGIEVFHRVLDDDEAALWPLLAQDVSFGVICDRLVEGHDPEVAAQLGFQLLLRWTSENLLQATLTNAS